MEPMTLGSPTHSPTGSPNTSFLPPFLMGEFNQPTSPRTNSLSPTKGRSLAFGNSPPCRPSPQHIGQYNTPIRQNNNSNMSFGNKTSGPPTQGLFDTIHQPDWNQQKPQMQSAREAAFTSPQYPFTSPIHHSSFSHQTQQDNYYNQIESSYANTSPFSQKQTLNQSLGYQAQNSMSNNDSVNYASPGNVLNGDNQANEDGAELWVTVFGFPQSAANSVITQFSNCGNIIEKKFPSQGNWVWIKFSSRSEARRALALNGRVLPGGLMVGTLPCNNPPSNNRGGARPLAVSSNRLNTSVLNTTNSGAQRSSGPLSRALEYVFGW